jgi:hypothetical protein
LNGLKESNVWVVKIKLQLSEKTKNGNFNVPAPPLEPAGRIMGSYSG